MGLRKFFDTALKGRTGQKKPVGLIVDRDCGLCDGACKCELPRRDCKYVYLKMCSECGVNPADPPGDLCPGCDAYKEHQSI